VLPHPLQLLGLGAWPLAAHRWCEWLPAHNVLLRGRGVGARAPGAEAGEACSSGCGCGWLADLAASVNLALTLTLTVTLTLQALGPTACAPRAPAPARPQTPPCAHRPSKRVGGGKPLAADIRAVGGLLAAVRCPPRVEA